LGPPEERRQVVVLEPVGMDLEPFRDREFESATWDASHRTGVGVRGSHEERGPFIGRKYHCFLLGPGSYRFRWPEAQRHGPALEIPPAPALQVIDVEF
ncbi:MAG: hypothetical protein AAFZ65_15275, partial [Planctomycetota bacterium]